MSDTEPTCRICRVEATSTQPLIHPCKCRGSIKYIHQECLLEWLEHSNNKAKRCDICNTPYRFVTLYDPNMPKSMPKGEILRKLVSSVKTASVKQFSLLLYGICLCQVPVYWKFVGRLCTYAVDGKMPSPTYSLFHVMAYGAYSHTKNGHLFSSPEATALEKFTTFMYNTYLSGLLQVVAFVLVLFVVFIEHEWVVREEGYTKLLLRQIGKEPKTKLADLLGSIIKDNTAAQAESNADVAPNATEEHAPPADIEIANSRRNLATRALGYIQQDVNQAFLGTNFRDALDTGEFDELFQHMLDREVRENELPVNIDMNQPSSSPSSPSSPSNGLTASAENGPQSNIDVSASDRPQNSGYFTDSDLEDWTSDDDSDSVDNMAHLNHSIADTLANNTENTMHAHQNIGNANINNHNNNDADVPADNAAANHSDEETAEELERRRNIAEDEMAAAEAANNNGNIFELLGLRLHPVMPISMMFLVNSAALLLLFFTYFIPHILGSFVALVAVYSSIGFQVLFILPVLRLLPLQLGGSFSSMLGYSKPMSQRNVTLVESIIMQQFVDPIKALINDVTALERVEPPNYLARFAFLCIGYGVVCFSINQLMTGLTMGGTPVTGSARRVYKVFFQITSTAKVFAVFAIEIVLFPMYCGWLLDFCLAPLFVSEIIRNSDSGPVFHIFFTLSNGITSNFVIRFALYWMWGTAYMFCIAMFVSMTRNHVLRPGVLYFIKSPEDPNARLIHDAVVKPFFLQMSRILLSAKVYSAFVIFGIGLVTWGIRFLVHAPGAKGALLPIRPSSLFSIQTGLTTVIILLKAEPIISKYCRIFWKRSFEVLCHKLRLSHFILGSPVPQERGRVVYRDMFSSFLGIGVPDYSKPVSYSEALEIFRTDPSVSACFVPNGSYLRAPSSDDNSRKFLRSLFVPVTKSDQLVSPPRSATYDDDTDWWDADVVCEDTYTVVYSPPNLRLRCLALVSMVSVFGALVFMVISVLAMILGRPIFRAWVMTTEAGATLLGSNMKLYEGVDWSLADVDSICIGLLVQLVGLSTFDSGPEASAVLNFAAEQRRRFAAPAANLRGFLARTALFLVHKMAQVFFLVLIHANYLTRLENKIVGSSVMSERDGILHFSFTWPGFIVHSLMGIFTIIPIFATVTSGMPETGNYKSWAKKVELAKLVSSMTIIVAHMVYQKAYGASGPEQEMYENLVILGMIVLIRVAMNARSLLHGIVEQIKAEKYVRGTAVQNNLDLAEE